MSQEALPPGSFSERIRSLRDSWEERRQVEDLATNHDFVRQYRLLLILHEWCAEALAQVAEIYGASLQLALSPRPTSAGEDTAFQVTVADRFSLVFGMAARSRDRRDAVDGLGPAAGFRAGRQPGNRRSAARPLDAGARRGPDPVAAVGP